MEDENMDEVIIRNAEEWEEKIAFEKWINEGDW